MVSTFSKRNTIVLVVFAAIALYSIIVNYRQFVVEPRKAEQRAAQREKEELAKDPLFSDVEYVKNPERKQAEEDERNRQLMAALQAKREETQTSQNKRLKSLSAATSIAHGMLVLTLGLQDEYIQTVDVEYFAEEAKPLSNEELIAGVSLLRITGIKFSKQLEQNESQQVPLRLEDCEARSALGSELLLSGMGKAYVTQDQESQRTVVDVELKLTRITDTQIEAAFEISRGEVRPSEGFIELDAKNGFRIFLEGSAFVDLPAQ